eukprot:5620331-Prymnesium_polylepis.1
MQLRGVRRIQPFWVRPYSTAYCTHLQSTCCTLSRETSRAKSAQQHLAESPWHALGSVDRAMVAACVVCVGARPTRAGVAGRAAVSGPRCRACRGVCHVPHARTSRACGCMHTCDRAESSAGAGVCGDARRVSPSRDPAVPGSTCPAY